MSPLLVPAQHVQLIVEPAQAQLHAPHAHLDFTFIKVPVCQLARLVSMSLLLVVAQHVLVSVRPVVDQVHAQNATLDFTFLLALV